MTNADPWKPANVIVRSAGRQVRQTLAKLDLSGYVEGRWTSAGHLKLRRPCGCATSISCSPSDHRASKNIATTMRRDNVAHLEGRAVCQ